MDTIRTWAFSLCAAMIVCSILRLLLPRGNLQRIYGLTLGVFILCCLLSPFFLARPELRLELTVQSEQEIEQRSRRLTETVEKQSEGAAAAEIEKLVLSKLQEMGIKHHAITIHISVKGQNESEEDQIVAELVLDAAHTEEREAILQELSRELGFPVTIAFS